MTEALLDPVAAAVRRAGPVTLPAGVTAGGTFVAVVAECRAQWETNEALLREHRHPLALHQCRVGLRRLRSAFSLFRATWGDAQGYAALAGELRAHALPLGPARDLDVLLSGDLVSAVSEDQLTRLHTAREQAYDAALAALEGASWANIKVALTTLTDSAPWGRPDPPAEPVATAALRRRFRRVRRGGRDLGALTPIQRHGVRIEAKKLRYGAQFFADLYPATDAPLAWAEEVGVLQDALGASHDQHAAALLLTSVGAVPPLVDEDALVAQAQVAFDALLRSPRFWEAAGAGR